MSKIQDFDYWRNRRLWSLREAAYLLNGKEPLSEDEFKKRDWCKSTTVGRIYDFIKEATLEGGELWSTDVGKLLVRRRIRPSDAINWALRRGMTIPSGLEGLAHAQAKVDESARTTPADSKKWTAQRISEMRVMHDRLKNEGARDYTKQTAKHFRVSAAYVRRLLSNSGEGEKAFRHLDWPSVQTKNHFIR